MRSFRPRWPVRSELFAPKLPKEASVSLQIQIREVGDVTILDLQGRVTIGLSNDQLSSQLRELTDAGARKILINLAGVPQTDSSGISSLVRSFVTLQRLGGSLRLLRPVGHVREVLELTRLLESIPSFDDEDRAVASFGQSVSAR
jgi:anti-sigma B factor antagonist